MNKLKTIAVIAYVAFILGILPLGIVESQRIISATYMVITGTCFAALATKFWLKKRN